MSSESCCKYPFRSGAFGLTMCVMHAGASSTTFSNNTSKFNGGDIAVLGNANMHVIGATFSGGVATESGGSIYTESNITLEECTITGAKVTKNSGGAIYVDRGAASIVNSKLYANEAYAGGAVAASKTAVVSIQGSHFANNMAEGSGGAVHAELNVQLYILPSAKLAPGMSAGCGRARPRGRGCGCEIEAI